MSILVKNGNYVPETKREIVWLQSSIVLCAPDDFYNDTSWLPEMKLDLDRAFIQLRNGVEHVFSKPRHAELQPKLLELADKAYAAYKANNKTEGIEFMVQFEEALKGVR